MHIDTHVHERERENEEKEEEKSPFLISLEHPTKRAFQKHRAMLYLEKILDFSTI